MAPQTLEESVESADSIPSMLRENGGLYADSFPEVPNEETNWIDEQRAIMEHCALADLSHHMGRLRLEGPDVIEFLSDFCVNNFDNFEIGKAKQAVLCNPNGYVIGDGPLLRIGEEEVWGVPEPEFATNWIEFNLEKGDYDVSAEVSHMSSHQGNPDTFIYQVQGPDALNVLDKVTDASLRDIPFYSFEEIILAGKKVRAFGHGMNTEPGFELHGSYEHADEVREAILEAGEEYGIKALGSMAYLTQSVRLGWVPPGPPPVYDSEEMKEYRQWLDANGPEANYSIGGSYYSDDVSDYYVTPVELGYEKLIDLDHDFVGKEAVEQEVEDPDRVLVSLKWNDQDVVDVYSSLFGDDENHKFMQLPRVGWARAPNDEVRKDGELVGLSHSRAYQWDVRGLISLCTIDSEYSEPGTEVGVVWGERSGSPNPQVEDHAQTEITATVEPAPYTKDRRKSDE